MTDSLLKCTIRKSADIAGKLFKAACVLAVILWCKVTSCPIFGCYKKRLVDWIRRKKIFLKLAGLGMLLISVGMLGFAVLGILLCLNIGFGAIVYKFILYFSFLSTMIGTVTSCVSGLFFLHQKSQKAI